TLGRPGAHDAAANRDRSPGRRRTVHPLGKTPFPFLRVDGYIPDSPGGSRRPESPRGGRAMPESVYKIIELVGTSTESWEKAAAAAVTKASKTLRDLRIAEISELDLQLENGKIRAYRAKVKLSFKNEGTGAARPGARGDTPRPPPGGRPRRTPREPSPPARRGTRGDPLQRQGVAAPVERPAPTAPARTADPDVPDLAGCG